MTMEVQMKSDITSIPTEAEFEFSDMTAMACLLCARQFKSPDQLKRHNKDSDLHKASDPLLPFVDILNTTFVLVEKLRR